MHYLFKAAWVWSVGCGSLAVHAAGLDAAASRRAVQAYCKTISAAVALDELEKHWSRRLQRDQAEVRAQQRVRLDAEMRASYQKTLLGMHKDMARKMPEQMEITCAPQRCTVVVRLTAQWTQSFVLVREKGQVVIDDARAHFVMADSRREPAGADGAL